MSDRVGQMWRIFSTTSNRVTFYLILDPGRRDFYNRWLHVAMNMETQQTTELQEVDGNAWESLPDLARFG